MSTVTQADTPAEGTETVTTTVTFPKELWRRVKIAAAEHDTSAQQICADGLELALKQLKQLASKKAKSSQDAAA